MYDINSALSSKRDVSERKNDVLTKAKSVKETIPEVCKKCAFCKSPKVTEERLYEKDGITVCKKRTDPKYKGKCCKGVKLARRFSTKSIPKRS